MTYNGETKAVGIVECKPDAASGNWGDTTGQPGTSFLKILYTTPCSPWTDKSVHYYAVYDRYFPPAPERPLEIT